MVVARAVRSSCSPRVMFTCAIWVVTPIPMSSSHSVALGHVQPANANGREIGTLSSGR